MKIGVAGRIGLGVALFAALSFAASWVVRVVDPYPFAIYPYTDAYLSAALVFGLALLAPSLTESIQTKRAADLSRLALTIVGPLPPETQLDLHRLNAVSQPSRNISRSTPDVPAPALLLAPSRFYRPVFTKIGRLCLLLAILIIVSAGAWRSTRNSVPLNAAMAIAPGHNLTPEFRVPLRAVHSMELSLGSAEVRTCGLLSAAKPPIQWRLLNSGRAVATGFLEVRGWRSDVVEEITIPRGSYQFDLVSPAACSVNQWGYPRLKVEADWQTTGLDDIADVLFCLLVGIGVALLLWPDVREAEELSLRRDTRATFRVMTKIRRPLQLLLPIGRGGIAPRFWAAGWFGVTAMLALVFSAMTLPGRPKGLFVRILKPEQIARNTDVWNRPIIVAIDSARGIFLNGRLLSRYDFESEVRRSLAARSDWSVYVDGDAQGAAGAVIEVVDLLRGIGIKDVFLVTPGMKRESPAVFASPPCAISVVESPQLPRPKKNHITGEYSTQVRFEVSERGTVVAAKVKNSSGDAKIDAWAVASVRKWKYSPMPGCPSREMDDTLSTFYWMQ